MINDNIVSDGKMCPQESLLDPVLSLVQRMRLAFLLNDKGWTELHNYTRPEQTGRTRLNFSPDSLECEKGF